MKCTVHFTHQSLQYFLLSYDCSQPSFCWILHITLYFIGSTTKLINYYVAQITQCIEYNATIYARPLTIYLLSLTSNGSSRVQTPPMCQHSSNCQSFHMSVIASWITHHITDRTIFFNSYKCLSIYYYMKILIIHNILFPIVNNILFLFSKICE